MKARTEPLPFRQALLRLDARTGRLSQRRYRLEVLAGAASGTRLELESALTLGSCPQAGLTLPDPTVSRYHVELTPRTDGVHVRDLGSTNGTYAAGVRVRDALIEASVVLSIGLCRVRLSVEDEDLGTPKVDHFGPLVTASPLMAQSFGLLERAANADVTLLLTGETGTGKGAIARAVHSRSHRASRPFVMVDCSSLAPSLVESELFGHVKGAFTDAREDREGAFLSAQGGTLFLDEIGELPLSLQPSLLRVIEEREVKRVGDSMTRTVDFRLVAATHVNLEQAVAEGRFRQDLFYRLAVLSIEVPPLRSRIEDIPLLAAEFQKSWKGRASPLPDRVLRVLENHPWRGNVRELRNVIDRLGALCPTAESLERVAPGELPQLLFGEGNHLKVNPSSGTPEPVGEEAEIREALSRCAGNQTLAAKMLGISRGTLVARLERYGIPRPRKST